MSVKQPRTDRGPHGTTRPPATLTGRVAVFALALTLAMLTGLVLARALAANGRRPLSVGCDDVPAAVASRQAREVEALQRRIAALSARLALTASCSEGPPVGASQPATVDIGQASREPAGSAVSIDAGAGDGGAAVASGREAGTPPALSTTWGTETFLRDLARTSAGGLTLDHVVCADELCRLAVSGRGTSEDDALALQAFVGRTAEWLPHTLIQPGVAGAPTVVLLARPGHDLRASASVNIDQSTDHQR